jgi:hypothetical protein
MKIAVVGSRDYPDLGEVQHFVWEQREEPSDERS